MRHLTRFAVAAVLVVAIAAPASAQNEQALRAFFEGRRVTLKIDMPGSSDGVDVHVDAARAIDYREYGDHLKEYGTAIRSGDTAVVTLVKLKKDLIEFQLGGGGFGTFGDDTSTSVNIKDVEKSSREKDLDKLIKDETDSRRKRELERERDALRDRRERENRRIEAERVRAEELKRERIAYQRSKGGSRFNLRYSGNVPTGIRPEDVMAALADYIEFAQAATTPSRTTADAAIRKGMLRSEVERVYGTPAESSTRREGSLTVATLVFVNGDERITAEFVEEVLVRYSITSK
ncbi:MAG: hypothetical protein AUH43_25525 [Acidobacteria bacterium 13_1_40CM_65_14]|nr:MAG: hypothetical protein AUH43_25525 [Acidobacteria bacterium 13_1_40CM_65_14]